MRIIAGTARSRTLVAPAGKATRPTQDSVREALFNILQARVQNARVLDLFAGSGALALEAVSRGAQLAVLVDQSRSAAAAITRNIEALGFGAQCTLLVMDARKALSRLKGTLFDLVLLDPPYDVDAAPFIAALHAEGLLATDALIVLEHQKGRMPVVTAPFLRLDARTYGDTGIALYAVGKDESDANLGIPGQF